MVVLQKGDNRNKAKFKKINMGKFKGRVAKMSSFGRGEEYKDGYPCKKDWPEECGLQGGSNGVVFSKSGNYNTAFFEAFPSSPKCFIRGEGKTVVEAEADAWEKYQEIIVCDHEMERRDRKDGYGYCKKCSYSATVFEPLTKCCKCGVPTSWSKDYKGNWYCKKHYRNKPKKPKHLCEGWELRREYRERRLPRKEKKRWKKGCELAFRINGRYGKVAMRKGGQYEAYCDGYMIAPLFRPEKERIMVARKRVVVKSLRLMFRDNLEHKRNKLK